MGTTLRGAALALAIGTTALTAVAHAQVSGSRPVAPPSQISDSLLIGPVMQAALGEIRMEFPFGRVVLDRVVADTGKRLLPPLMSRREHPRPEDWAKRERIETAATELTSPECNVMRTQCRLQGDIVGVIAFSDPAIWTDSARVIARYNSNFGDPPTRVRTTVVELTLRLIDGRWKVQKQRIRATG
ncbi:MAG TPA: hypothetical protein VJR92_14025 [Gemmatimonadaceae bacterium]|nr:hypothetical protein [Gemmatimonadaceae bacterium]